METVLLLFALEKVFVCLDRQIEQSNYGTSKLIKKFIYLGRFPTDRWIFFGDTTVLWFLGSNLGYIYRENPDRDHKGAVNSVDIHPSDSLCVSGSGDRSVRVWNFENDSTQGF